MGSTSQFMHPKSPLRYHCIRFQFSTTATLTASVMGALPAAAKIKDIVVTQAAAGVGGTSFAVTVKKNGTSVCSTDAVIALADGANKNVNLAASPMGAIAKPTGATRPVLDATKASCSQGDVFTADITLTGSYSTAVTGAVCVYLEPRD